jgi:hypothetical protein
MADERNAVEVFATSEEMRAVLKHPTTGMGFNDPDIGVGVFWPNDQFTTRRLRDGDVSLESGQAGQGNPVLMAQEQKVQEQQAQQQQNQPQREQTAEPMPKGQSAGSETRASRTAPAEQTGERPSDETTAG